MFSTLLLPSFNNKLSTKTAKNIKLYESLLFRYIHKRSTQDELKHFVDTFIIDDPILMTLRPEKVWIGLNLFKYIAKI